MFRGFGHFRKRGLRPLTLAILRRSPRNGMEIMDEIENMTQGWWRPSPGSVYPMLDEMVKDGLVKKRGGLAVRIPLRGTEVRGRYAERDQRLRLLFRRHEQNRQVQTRIL